MQLVPAACWNHTVALLSFCNPLCYPIDAAENYSSLHSKPLLTTNLNGLSYSFSLVPAQHRRPTQHRTLVAVTLSLDILATSQSHFRSTSWLHRSHIFARHPGYIAVTFSLDILATSQSHFRSTSWLHRSHIFARHPGYIAVTFSLDIPVPL
jgi:hypothetical protein